MTYKLDGWPRKKNRTPLLDYIKLCASFQSHRWIQTCVTYSLETPNSGQNRLFFVQYNLEIWWMALKYNKAPLLCYFKLCASFHSHCSIQTGVTVWKHQVGSKSVIFFVLFDPAIWQMPLKNNRVHLVWYFNLCASFHSHRSIQAGVTIRKCQIRVQIVYFLSRVTLKFDGWPWKTIGHLFYAKSSFVHHFIAIYEFKLELQSGNC